MGDGALFCSGSMSLPVDGSKGPRSTGGSSGPPVSFPRPGAAMQRDEISGQFITIPLVPLSGGNQSFWSGQAAERKDNE